MFYPQQQYQQQAYAQNPYQQQQYKQEQYQQPDYGASPMSPTSMAALFFNRTTPTRSRYGR